MSAPILPAFPARCRRGASACPDQIEPQVCVQLPFGRLARHTPPPLLACGPASAGGGGRLLSEARKAGEGASPSARAVREGPPPRSRALSRTLADLSPHAGYSMHTSLETAGRRAVRPHPPLE